AMVSGQEIRYDVGGGSHPLLGRRMPHLELLGAEHKTSTTELLRTGRGLLLDLAGNARLRQRAVPWAARVDTVVAEPQDGPAVQDLAGTTALLIRPDGHVAWAAPGSHHD